MTLAKGLIQAVCLSVLCAVLSIGLHSTGVRGMRPSIHQSGTSPPGSLHTTESAATIGNLPGDASTVSLRGAPDEDVRSPRSKKQRRPAVSTHEMQPERVRQADRHAAESAPLVIQNAVVTGPASPEKQAEFDADSEPHGSGLDSGAGPQRSLLHGSRRPARYSICDTCTIDSCQGRACTGHCREDRKLFSCAGKRPRRGSGPECLPVEQDIFDIPFSPLEPPAGLVLIAPSPYIGCVSIRGQDSRIGCPSPGTRGVVPATGDSAAIPYEVQASTCTYTRYLPDCTTSPLYPVGVCRCLAVADDGEHLGFNPCVFTELEVNNSPPGLGELSVEIERRGASIYTGISDYSEPRDRPDEVYTVTVPPSESGPTDAVNVRLLLFRGLEIDVDEGTGVLEEEGMISEDYYVEPPAPPDAPAGPFPRGQSPLEDCILSYNEETQRTYYDYDYCFYDRFVDYIYIPDYRV